MELTAYEIAFISGGFGIAGTMAGAWLNHRLSVIRSYFDARHLAGMRLREAFSVELATLQCSINPTFDASNFLEAVFIKHQTAVNEFRLFLTDKERTAFSKVWHKYYNGEIIPYPHDMPFFEKYSKKTDPKGKEKAIKNIEDILSFTVPPKLKWYHYLFKK